MADERQVGLDDDGPSRAELLTAALTRVEESQAIVCAMRRAVRLAERHLQDAYDALDRVVHGEQ